MRPLNAGALDEHRFLMQGTDAEKHLSKAGRIALYRSPQSFNAGLWELNFAKEMGVPFEVAGPREIAAIEPHVKPAFSKAVIWTSSTRFTDPGAITTAYAGKFANEGGNILRANVLGLAKEEKGWRVEITEQVLEATDVVICAGPWAANMLRPLGYSFPLGIKRGYHRHFEAENGAQFAHAFADIDLGYVLAPMEEGLRIDTGAEFADMDVPPNPAQLHDILPYARQLFPLGKALGTQAWCGGRPCFPDSMPAIGPSRHANLWLNIGHGHSGMTIGPSSARLLAELMMGEKPFCDPTPYHPARFKC
jgi:D-amino-acid dehydrogenase